MKIIKKISYSERLKIAEQSLFLQQLAELLQEGFSIAEALHFFKIINPKKTFMYEEMLQRLESGELFPHTLAKFGFSNRMISQLSLSFLHGNFKEALLFSAADLSTRKKQLDAFKQIATYPLLLVIVAFIMLLAIRTVLLPVIVRTEASSNIVMNSLVLFLTYLPQIICVHLLLVVATCLIASRFIHSLSAYEKACFYCRLPILGKWLKKYYSFIFSREVGFFFSNGHSISQTLQMMQRHSNDLLTNELSKEIEDELLKGTSFSKVIQKIPIFTEELTWLIAYGEKTSQLGLKLKVFAEELYRQMMQKIEKSIQTLQPILFSFIGFIIVFIYLMLMLPMLDMMKGVF